MASLDTLPKLGVLLFGSARFRKLGGECPHGDYEARKERFAREFVARIGEFAHPVFDGIVYDRADVERSIQSFHAGGVDGVVCVFLSWTDDKAWIAFLRDMYDVPMLLYLPTPPGPDFKDTRDEDDFIDFLARGGLVGTLEASGSVPRLGRRMEVVTGAFAATRCRLVSFARAALARRRLRAATFGLLANYNELMWSTYVHPYDIFARVGPELVFISYDRLAREVRAVDDPAAQAYMRELAARYVVEDDVDEKLFLESARASLALARLRDGQDLDALVLNDVDHELFETIGLRPGFYPPAFNAHGAVMVPEGDLGAATVTYALKWITGQSVSFVEPFYMDPERNTFSAGHAGPHDHTDERYRDRVRISRDVRFAKTAFKYAGAPFAWYRIPPGPKTLAHFSEVAGAYKIVCFLAEVLPGEHALCSYSHADFRVDCPVAELFERVIRIGTTQHFAVVAGDVREDLALFARINGFDFHAV